MYYHSFLGHLWDIFGTLLGHIKGILKAYKPQINADERRYALASEFCKKIHRKVGYEPSRFIDEHEKGSVADFFIQGRKERKALQQESLCPLCSLWLNVFFAPVHERAPSVPAVHLRLNRAGG